MRTPSLALLVLAIVGLLAMGSYHALGEAALLRTLFYLAVAAFVAGVVWMFNSDD